MTWASAAVTAAVLAALLAGCGANAPDLFELRRSGAIPGARLTLRVSDDGTVRCNGGAARRMPDEQLLAARQIARDLQAPAASGLSLEPGPNAVLSYRVRLPDGTVSFTDVSAAPRPQLARVAAFARTVAKRVCGLPR